MNKKPTIQVRPGKPGQPTPEQIAAEHYRAFSQQMQSIAQAIMYNSLHTRAPQTTASAVALVDRSLEMAAHYMHAAGPAVQKAFEKQMALAASGREAKEKGEE